jgi:hypothetical protein
MKSITRFAAFAAALSLLVASPGFASTIVAGDVETDVKVKNVKTQANGLLATAETSVGSVNDGSIVMGRVRTDVEAKNVKTQANGLLATAETCLGSVGGC